MVVSLRRFGRLASVLGLLAACSEPDRSTGAVGGTARTTSLATPIILGDDGLPRLLRGTSLPIAPTKLAADAARFHVAQLASQWHVATSALPSLDERGTLQTGGNTLTRLQQRIDGLPIDREELRLLIGPDGTLHAASGTLFGTDVSRTPARFTDDAPAAIARALGAHYQRPFDRAALAPARAKSSTAFFQGTSNGIAVQLARAEQVWHVAGSRSLIAAWVVEAYASDPRATAGDAFRIVLAAADGRVLARTNLVDDAAFGYRVFADAAAPFQASDGPTADFSPHPTGTADQSYPPYAPPTLVTVEGLNHPSGSSSPDPWLPANAVETVGNNVDTYADFNAPSGLSNGDFRAIATAGKFDHAYDTSTEPLSSTTQQMAAITSLFYNINWLHDFWYDAGFTEATGNAQDNNYGRGGQDRDAMLAEAQDNALAGSRNNANMSTPGDGMPPRMQVFLWSGKIAKSMTLAPSNRMPAVGHANFGPKTFDVTGTVALANDSVGANPNDGCEPFALPSQIALVDRGNCDFVVKAANAQAGGALGMIVANNVAAGVPQSPLGGTNAALTIPTLSVTLDEGTAIKTELATLAPVTARMRRSTSVELDGSLDATLVAHEFGHYLHHRLTPCNTTLCSAMSEGWGDYLALVQMVRPTDNLATGVYPFSVYTTQSFNDDPGYYGIRRVPYSVDRTKNALSFRHMADGEALPTEHPMLPSGNNAEVHNAGEIWAAMLWEGYVALQLARGAATFEETHAKMARYIVAGLLLAPTDATPTETRDAILAGVLATSKPDHDTLAAAFARRGFGSCAISPVRASRDFKGIVESTEVKGHALPGPITLDDSVRSCDGDNVLDHTEQGRLAFPLSNAGATDLTDVTITITSPTPGLVITTPPITLASLPAYTSTTIEAEVTLANPMPTAATAGTIEVTIASPGGCTETKTLPFAARLDVDDYPLRSATEKFDATSTWTIEGDSWRQVRETALDGYMHGPAPGAITDARLRSPSLQVGPDPFAMTFTHRHEFELTDGTYWDGGVIEYSTDGGITWADIATLANVSPGYTGQLTDRANNPLANRLAYGGTNASHPNADTVTIDFGTQLANQSVQLRFRLGADVAVGTPGWELDDVAFTGLLNTPFPSQENDDGACSNSSGDAGGGGDAGMNGVLDDGGCCSTTPLRAGNLGLAFGVLALVMRRRRR